MELKSSVVAAECGGWRRLQTPPDAPRRPQTWFLPRPETAGRSQKSNIHILKAQVSFPSLFGPTPSQEQLVYNFIQTHTHTHTRGFIMRSCLHVKTLPLLETFENVFTLTSLQARSNFTLTLKYPPTYSHSHHNSNQIMLRDSCMKDIDVTIS